MQLTRSTLPIGSKLIFWYGAQGAKNSLTVEQDLLDATASIMMAAQLVLSPDDRQEVNVSVTPNGAGQYDFTISQYEADSLLGAVSYVVNDS